MTAEEARDVIAGRLDLVARPAHWTGTARGFAWTPFPEPQGSLNELDFSPQDSRLAYSIRHAKEPLPDGEWVVAARLVLGAEGLALLETPPPIRAADPMPPPECPPGALSRPTNGFTGVLGLSPRAAALKADLRRAGGAAEDGV